MMSTMRMSMVLSLAVASAGVMSVRATHCEAFVEQPAECRKAPGCVVKDEWDCVPDEEGEKRGRVWVVFPPAHAHAPSVPSEQEVPGVPVAKSKLLEITNAVGVVKFPPFLEETHFHPVPSIQKGGGLRFECPESAKKTCDFYVTVFSCGHCKMNVDGGLPGVLTVTHGWEPRSCAPAMEVRGEQYKMKIFRVRVRAGATERSPRLPRNAYSVAVFSSTEPTEYCPAVRPVGPSPPMWNCGAKCPFDSL